ncbi:hypothetical protein F8388_005721 [Cannabis sativa]|uniref:peroxidase n=1 Tax=Cannabis sativa TaxID=3483 RepID=A0A7J6H8K8_CANSA|nr:hypothetical protein F8388_005721 [Cannabis sativa]
MIKMASPRSFILALPAIVLVLALFMTTVTAQSKLSTNFYKNSCPNVESLVRSAVNNKFRQTFVTAPATLRLFFHDCFVRGCDASVMLSSPNGNAEKDHPDNLSLAGDGFDTVIKAKAAVDRDSRCRNKVSCADILALATRDVVVLQGKGLFTSDQILFTDNRSKSVVNSFASSPAAFNKAFADAMTKLGRVGVLTGTQGEIRKDCTRPN